VGLVFLLFGILKFFPDVSPEELTIKTTDALSFDLIPGHIAIVLIASLECIVGLLLITGRRRRGSADSHGPTGPSGKRRSPAAGHDVRQHARSFG